MINYFSIFLLFPITSIVRITTIIDIGNISQCEWFRVLSKMSGILDAIIYYFIFDFIIRKLGKNEKKLRNFWVFYIFHLLNAIFWCLYIKSMEFFVLLFIPSFAVIPFLEKHITRGNATLIIFFVYLIDVGLVLILEFLFYKFFKRKIADKKLLRIMLIISIFLLILYSCAKTFVAFLFWIFYMIGLYS